MGGAATRIVASCSGLLAACTTLAAAQQSTGAHCDADSARGTQSIRLYLSPIRVDSGYRLTPYSYSGATHVEQNVDFAEHADSAAPTMVVGVPTRRIDTRNAVQFVSPPLAGPFDLSGAFAGQVELITNKPDFDFQIALYELTPSGEYVLSSTYSTLPGTLDGLDYRMPLQTGVRQYRKFESACFPTRVVQNGSSLLVLITILRAAAAGEQTVARDSDRTMIPDANFLKVGWYGESYVELRVRHH